MKLKWFTLIFAAILAIYVARPGQADVNVGLSIGENGLQSFYLAIGSYYNVPEKTVVVVHERRIPDEELPVVFFLAQQAKVSPDVVINLRLSGQSWMDIAFHYGLTAQAFYVPLAVVPGPPYGKAYGYYKNRPQSKWKEIRLSDADIVNFMNLKFVSGYYGYSPDEIVKMRGAGKGFVTISNEVKKSKGGPKGNPQTAGPKAKSKGKGKR